MKNVRDMTVTPDQGKDVRDSNVLGGQAKESSAFKAKNETTQYTTGKTSMGSLGGENTNS